MLTYIPAQKTLRLGVAMDMCNSSAPGLEMPELEDTDFKENRKEEGAALWSRGVASVTSTP